MVRKKSKFVIDTKLNIAEYIVTVRDIASAYFDDKWDTAFGVGWRCGNEYREKEQKNNE